MSEVLAVHDEAGTQGENAKTSMTAGTLLRQAREAAGLSLAGLAAALKVPAPKLEALEADDYAAFQDHVFMRALAQSVCRTLRVDSASVLALLPRTQLKSLADDRGSINATFKERSFKATGTPLGRENGSRKVAIIVLLLAAAAAVYFLPKHEGDAEEPQAGSSDAAALVSPAATVSEPVAAQEPVAPAVTAPASEGAAPAAPAPAAPAATPAVQAPAAAAPAAGVPGDVPADAAAATPATQAAQTPGGVLVMKASAQSWVQVKDANGRVVLQKTLAAGESVGAEGALPLSVIVGNASGTEVRVRGELLEVAKTTRDNVARFEVK